MINNQVVKKPFHCRSCHVVLGHTDGERLYVGDFAIFTLRVTITCSSCLAHRVWKPIGLQGKFYPDPIQSPIKEKSPVVEENIIAEKTIDNT